MENKQTATLEALSVFIQTQKTLLTRTQADIERLRQLQQEDVGIDGLLPLIIDQKSDNRLLELELVDDASELPESIDWSLFSGKDTTNITNLTRSLKEERLKTKEPSKFQHSKLSPLQTLVKTARKTIIDPILAQCALMSEPESSDEEEKAPALSPTDLKRQREHQKIRELRSRHINAAGLTVSSLPHGMNGVFIRRDTQDETLDVDISADDDAVKLSPSFSAPMDIDSPATTVSLPSKGPAVSSPASSAPIVQSKPKRIRKPPVKGKAVEDGAARRRLRAVSSSTAKTKPSNSTTQAEESVNTNGSSSIESSKKKTAKPRPETYKQAWSDDEQRELERLLEEIPDGEKNRWLKISQAMEGRRTPRQVASRVQKYLLKLQRFGIGVGDGE